MVGGKTCEKPRRVLYCFCKEQENIVGNGQKTRRKILNPTEKPTLPTGDNYPTGENHPTEEKSTRPGKITQPGENCPTEEKPARPKN